MKTFKGKYKSMKGQMNHVVGAPSIPVRWPKGQFTIAQLVKTNNHQCELSIRNKVTDRLDEDNTGKNGLIQLVSKRQSGGKVGRPQAVFIETERFNKDTMTKFGAAETSATKKTTKAKSKKGSNKTRSASRRRSTPASVPAVTVNAETTNTPAAPVEAPAAPAATEVASTATPEATPEVVTAAPAPAVGEVVNA